MPFPRFSPLERAGAESVVLYEPSPRAGGFRRSFRRHSDESNLASVGVRKQFRELIYGWHVVHIREQNQGIVRQPRNLRFMQGKLIHTVLRFSSLTLSHSPSISLSIFLSLSLKNFYGKLASRVFPRNEMKNFHRERLFSLDIRDHRMLRVSRRASPSARDVCDFIIIAIYDENLQFRTQSIRKLCLIMVITNPSCNL